MLLYGKGCGKPETAKDYGYAYLFHTVSNYHNMRKLLLAIVGLCYYSIASGQQYNTRYYQYNNGYRQEVGSSTTEVVNQVPLLPEYKSDIPSIDLIMKVGAIKEQQYQQQLAAIQGSIRKVTSTYNSFHNYPPVSDGWHKVYYTNGYDQLSYTECNVKHSQVIDFRSPLDFYNNPGAEEISTYPLAYSGTIQNCSSQIKLKRNNNVYTLYFIDFLKANN